MSTARPMANTRRESIYLRDRSVLTPAQRRRLRRKHYAGLR